jgi:AraC-like DNA-binding protein
MLSNAAPLSDLSSVPITQRGALARPPAPRPSMDRQARISTSRRNDSDRPAWLHGGGTRGLFPHTTENRTISTGAARKASTTRIEEFEPQGESLLQLLADEGESLNRLYRFVSHVGCDVLLCDERGDLICHQSSSAVANYGASRFQRQIDNLVAEDLGRTDAKTSASRRMHGEADGIAGSWRPVPLAAFDRQPVSSTSLASPDSRTAPIFNADGNVIGYLKMLSTDSALPDRAFELAGVAMNAAARAIEERSFRRRYRREWIIALVPGEPAGCCMLLAVDRRQRVVGADRQAKVLLSGADLALTDAPSLWALFENSAVLFRSVDIGDVRTTLVRTGGGETWSALVTPPEPGGPYRRTPEQVALHCRPRLDSIGYFHEPTLPARSRGGLAPRVLQRVCDYMEAHLGENVELEALADIAGLSRFHFARAFKQSVGIAPHSYLMQRRVERAKALVIETKLSLAQIALECGFSDQSHFARRFLQFVGVTPRSFRWSAR